MRVSVIIPNYNHVAFLNDRITSVLAQTFQDFEIILLDDNSTDRSREVIKQYQNHPKVSQIVLNEQNSGSTFKQWNKGVALAKGEIIWIAESDDKADSRFLETLVKVLEREPNVGIAYANSYFIDEDNNVLRTYQEEYATWSDRWQYDFVNNGSDEVILFLRFAPIILNVSSCIFRKNIFLQAGGCDESYKLAGDWFTYVKMLQHSNIAYCARPLNYFRTHSQTVRSSSRQFILFFESIKVVCYIYNHFNVPYTEKKIQAYNLLAQFRQLAPQFTSDEKAKVMQYLRHHYMRFIDLLRWKYEASLLVKRITKSG